MHTYARTHTCTHTHTHTHTHAPLQANATDPVTGTALETEAPTHTHAHAHPCTHDVAKQLRITKQLIGSWQSVSAKLFSFIDQDSRRIHTGNGTSWRHLSRCVRRTTGLVDFPLAELVLFEEFVYKREVLGIRLSGPQVKIMFQIILRLLKPTSSRGKLWWQAHASDGWLTRWKRRFDIGSKLVTRKKQKSLTEMIPIIARWHRSMVTEIPCAIRVRNPCPDYGCFLSRGGSIWIKSLCRSSAEW